MIRHFGCELEFSSNKIEVMELLAKALKNKLRRLDVRDYHKWQVKDDASTIGEIVTPISTMKTLPKILEVCKLLRNKGIKVTRDDGFHVHVEIKKSEIPKVVGLWLRCERDMEFVFPKYRRNNYYCKRLSKQKKYPPVMDLVDSLEKTEEHHAVLSTYRDDIGTIEFRLAEGTLDPNFVRAWITFCVKFVEYASKQDTFKIIFSKPYVLTLKKIMKMIGLPAKDRKILLRRKTQNRKKF